VTQALERVGLAGSSGYALGSCAAVSNVQYTCSSSTTGAGAPASTNAGSMISSMPHCWPHHAHGSAASDPQAAAMAHLRFPRHASHKVLLPY
jgi:hypothetical protein